jgi:hypothetical protein
MSLIEFEKKTHMLDIELAGKLASASKLLNLKGSFHVVINSVYSYTVALAFGGSACSVHVDACQLRRRQR